MELLQPDMLWGTLALAIPVIIHFWYQKKGKVLEWAATQWLADKTRQQHRGLRLDELLLLLIRCLLVIILVLILCKPIADWLDNEQDGGAIHLVEPNQRLIDNYRFELQKAISEGEKVFWIGPGQEAANDISVLPKHVNSIFNLQESISKRSKDGKALHLYIRNSSSLSVLSKVYVPNDFTLHTVVDSTANSPSYMDLGAGKKLYVDKRKGEAGKLKITGAEDGGFGSDPVHTGKIEVLLEYKDPSEQQTVKAALLALSEVYSIPFQIDPEQVKGKKYDLVFTTQKVESVDPSTLYIVQQGPEELNTSANVIQIPDSMRLQTSLLVQNGQLPEWLGDLLVRHFKLKENSGPMSQKQVRSLFVKVKPVSDPSEGPLHQWLLLIFVTTLILERWMAMRKNVSKSYA
jgi:hypothetical protein